jgi:hypothetical protein
VNHCVLPLDHTFGKFEHIKLWVLAKMKQNNPNLNDDVFDSMLHDMTIDLQKTKYSKYSKSQLFAPKMYLQTG